MNTSNWQNPSNSIQDLDIVSAASKHPTKRHHHLNNRNGLNNCTHRMGKTRAYSKLERLVYCLDGWCVDREGMPCSRPTPARVHQPKSMMEVLSTKRATTAREFLNARYLKD